VALSPVFNLLVLAALNMGAPLSVVTLAREMSMMLGALLGMVCCARREAVGRWRIVGCLVTVVGIVLLGGRLSKRGRQRSSKMAAGCKERFLKIMRFRTPSR
ncbi:MAG: hypothetical protein JOZ17_19200, partial [Acetobacteraceae bacterium]|nr:hypothetical protein [Acetobacteraceae bacterium]